MLLLILLQSVLLFALAALVFYWRLQSNQALLRLTSREAGRAASLRNIQSAMANLQSELAEWKDSSRDRDNLTREPQSPPPDSPHPANALSIAKRSQALKMIRRGEAVETIAAAVGAPQSQIRLLQKVNALIDAAA